MSAGSYADDVLMYDADIIICSLARMHRAQQQRRELIGAAVIGCLMVVLGTVLMTTASHDLAHHGKTVGTAISTVVAIFGAASSYGLYRWKMHYGKAMGSAVAITDAKCSRCVGFVSVSVVLALVAQRVVWWADGGLGLLLAVYIVYEGGTSLKVRLDTLQHAMLI